MIIRRSFISPHVLSSDVDQWPVGFAASDICVAQPKSNPGIKIIPGTWLIIHAVCKFVIGGIGGDGQINGGPISVSSMPYHRPMKICCRANQSNLSSDGLYMLRIQQQLPVLIKKVTWMRMETNQSSQKSTSARPRQVNFLSRRVVIW